MLSYKKNREHSITELNKRDRRILDKYTKYYTNMIESNTPKTNIFEAHEFSNKELDQQ